MGTHPLKSEYTPHEERGQRTSRKAQIPWQHYALEHHSPLHPVLNGTKEPKRQHLWWLETCACLFHSYTSSSYHTLHLTLHSPPAQELEAQRGKRRERRKRKLTIPCPTPAPYPVQPTGRQACREYSEGVLWAANISEPG